MENGVVTLINTKQFPFNNSVTAIALKADQDSADYHVLTEVVHADGETGEVRVFDKAVNGFKIAFSGSAKSADVRYCVLGGGTE